MVTPCPMAPGHRSSFPTASCLCRHCHHLCGAGELGMQRENPGRFLLPPSPVGSPQPPRRAVELAQLGVCGGPAPGASSCRAGREQLLLQARLVVFARCSRQGCKWCYWVICLFLPPPKIKLDGEWLSSCQNNKQRLIVACGLHYSELRDFCRPQNLSVPGPTGASRLPSRTRARWCPLPGTAQTWCSLYKPHPRFPR